MSNNINSFKKEPLVQKQSLPFRFKRLMNISTAMLLIITDTAVASWLKYSKQIGDLLCPKDLSGRKISSREA